MEKVSCSKCGADNTIKAKYCSSCGYELPKIEVDNVINPIQQDHSSKSGNMNKIIRAIVGVIFFALAYNGVQQLFFKSASYDKEMISIANEINKSCPITIDAETRLDNTIALPDKVFQYNYTLVNVEKSKADTLMMKNYLEPIITNQVKSNPQLQYQRDHKWTLSYLYKDKNGLYLLMIRVTPDKYEK